MSLLTEPTRKNLLDVVQSNLRAAGRKTYVTRVVYFGEYYGTHEALCKRMEGIIHELRVDYSDMPITGLFLVYPSYYIHVLEAWQDIIYKHYQLVYSTSAESGDECKFGKAIPLPSYHHVHQRFFTTWCHAHATPPTLLDTLEGHTLDYIEKQVSNCLEKVYMLCEYLGNVAREKAIGIRDALQASGPKAAQYLPESKVLEFLLRVESPVLRTVQDYLRVYSDVSPSAFWDDNNVWPPPCSLMPRDIFDESGHRKVSSDTNSEK